MAVHRSRASLAALVLALVLTVSLSCSRRPLQNEETASPTESPLGASRRFDGLTLEVEAPFSNARLAIDPDGAATYEASSPETGIDQVTDHGRIPSDELLRLVETVQDADFFSLDDAYPYRQGVSYEDGSTYTIQVTIEGRTKRVTCYQSECPSKFNQVMSAIRGVWEGDILEVGV